jgi:P-type E1-E2 ATPase
MGMLSITIPGFGDLDLHTLVLDVNGTLTTDGTLVPGVHQRLAALRQDLEVRLLTADTRGTAAALAEGLDLILVRVQSPGETEAKRAYIESIGAQHVVAIGNGANDAAMLASARLGIAVIGHEGAAARTLGLADVVVCHVSDALDLLIDPVRLISTLRG